MHGIELCFEIIIYMGCSVSKQDVKQKTKYPFLPEDYRDVKTEAVMKRSK
jgi:hypothetical protein